MRVNQVWDLDNKFSLIEVQQNNTIKFFVLLTEDITIECLLDLSLSF